MTATKYDWVTLKTKFIAGNLSARAFATEQGIHPATLHSHAKVKDAEGRTWYDLQELRSSKVSDKTIVQLAEVEARQRVKEAQLVLKGLEVIESAFDNAIEWAGATRTFQREGEDVTERIHRIPMREVASLMDRLAVLMGRAGGSGPAQEDGEPSGPFAGLLVTAGADTEIGGAFLAGVAAAAARNARGAEPRAVVGGGASSPEGAS